MDSEFDKRINLVCIATGLKEADPSKLSSLAELERKEARENASSLMPDWMTAIYSDSRDMTQSVPLPPVFVDSFSSDPLVIVAQLPPRVIPESVTATYTDGTTVTEVNVTGEGLSSPVKGLNVYLREDIVGDYVVYAYFYNSPDTYLLDSSLQLRYKVQG